MNKDIELENKRKDFFEFKANANSSDIFKERLDSYNKERKIKIRKKLFNKENCCKEKIKYEKNNEFNISTLSIDKEFKDEFYTKQILDENNFDKIFYFINLINKESKTIIDLNNIKYGLLLLKEKFLLLKDDNLLKELDFINRYNFKELIFCLLSFSKNESNKIIFDQDFLTLIYDVIINYSYKSDNTSFLLSERFLNLHTFFLEFVSEEKSIKNILILINNLLLDNHNLCGELFVYNNKIFFNKLIELMNDYPNDIELQQIILYLFTCYINNFQNFYMEAKENSNKEIEMKDRTNFYSNDIFESIYNISLMLIFSKQKILFGNSLYLISNIIKIISKSEDFDLFQKLINNKNFISMILFLLEKDFTDDFYSIIYICDILKSIIKYKYNNNSNHEINELINIINSSENNILIFLINHLLIADIKEKIIIKILSLIYILIENGIYMNKLSTEEKYEICNIIIKLIKSSNYKIRKKSLKIIEKISNKRDYKLADFLMKNKILEYIKEAIDPSITYCKDEKLILLGLKTINNLLTLGEVIKSLNGVNSVLLEFENIGGKEMLENLQCNKSQFVYDYTSNLIDNYFN
jgi:hypothetical protein